MHPDIEKLISIAKETGGLTEKQKEIILRKAEILGEDLVEVELILESAQLNQKSNNSSSIPEKRKKCPNCGAVISDSSFKCTECGYTFQNETKASTEARQAIDSLQEKLTEAAKPTSDKEILLNPFAASQRQSAVITAFTMPTTKEGLTQFLEFSYSNYLANTQQDWGNNRLKNTWYGKALQAYNSLARLGEDDPSIQKVLENYSFLKEKANKIEEAQLKETNHSTMKAVKKFGKGCLIFYAVFVVVGLIIAYVFMFKENSRQDKIEHFLEMHDYQSAKAVTDSQWEIDRISCKEVSYLILQGDFNKAKVIASGIKDLNMKNDALKEIQEAENIHITPIDPLEQKAELDIVPSNNN